MAYVTGFTADRMLRIESESIKTGYVNENGALILVRRDGVEISAGEVTGSDGVSFANLTPFFLQQHKSSAPPSPPMVLEPSPESPWKLEEPPYAVDTNLYMTTRITYTDGTFRYTNPIASSSYSGVGQASASSILAQQAAEASEAAASAAVSEAQAALSEAQDARTRAEEAVNASFATSGDLALMQTELADLSGAVDTVEAGVATATANAQNAQNAANTAMERALAAGASTGNLLLNGAFDVVTASGVPIYWETPNATNRFYDTASPRSSPRSLKMVSTTAEYSTKQVNAIVGTRGKRFYAIEGYVKMAVKGSVAKVGFRLKQLSSAGSVVETKQVEVLTSALAVGSWYKLSGIVETTLDSAVGGEFSVYLGAGTGGTFNFDDIFIVDVTEAVAAQASANAANQELTQAKQRLNLVEADLLGKQSEIDTLTGNVLLADGRITVSPNAPTVGDGEGKPIGAIWEVTSGGVSTARYTWSGAAWTQVKAGPNFIGDNAIGAAHIINGSIGTAEIGDAQITNAKIGDLSVSKLTATGGAKFNSAVVSTLLADTAFVNRLVAERALITGPSNLIPNGNVDRGNSAPWSPFLVYQTVDKPSGLPAALTTSAGRDTVHPANGPDSWIDVVPGSKYRFEVWLKASLPNSVVYLYFNDVAGKVCFTGDIEEVPGVTKPPASATYTIAGLTVPTTWTKYALVHTVAPGITRIRINNILMNHRSGTEKNAEFSLAGARFTPLVGADLIVNGSILIGNLDPAILEGVADDISSSESAIKTSISQDIDIAVETYSETAASLYAKKDDIPDVAAAIGESEANTATRINGVSKVLSDSLEALRADVTERANKQDIYIRIDDTGILLGQKDSPFKVRITNTEMAFTQDGFVVAYLSNNKLYTTDVSVTKGIQIGKFVYEPRDNGNLSFKYRS